MVQHYYRNTVAEIDLDAIGHNVRAFRSWLPAQTAVMAVVKANAYGHGAEPVAREALKSGASHIAVATLDEAIELFEAGIEAPILVMGYIPEHGLAEAISRKIRITTYREDHLQQIIKAAEDTGQPAVVHLKAETGMGRIGAQLHEVEPLIKQALGSRYVRLEGLFTHFACADESDKAHTVEQEALFRQFLKRCEQLGADFSLVHCGNSATAIDLPQFGYNAVRVGISLYGLYPSAEVNRRHVLLKPAMTLKTEVVHVKRVAAGSGISYGATYRPAREETIATLPIGYADGFNRLLSNRGSALVRGRRVPIVGRICMDQTMIKIPDDVDVRVGDEVVLYGRQGDAEIHVDEVAALLGTINYEVTCMVSRRIPRVYKRDGQRIETRTDVTKIIQKS